MWQELRGEDEREERNRRLGDAGDARVDVRLSPRDEPHRDGSVDDAEHRARNPRPAELAHRSACAHAPGDVGEEQDPREQHAELRHRRRRDVLDRNLDEEVRGAPHRGQGEDQRPVRAHRARLQTACGLTARIGWPPEQRDGSGPPSRTRSHRLGVRANPLPARARPERLRARGLLAPLVGALRLQALGAPPEAPALARVRAFCRGRARTQACSTSATGSPSRSRSRATITPRRSSPSRARRRVWAGSCATSSRWARGRSPSSTACASRSPTGTSPAPSAASATTATASASRPSVAKPCSTSRTATTVS